MGGAGRVRLAAVDPALAPPPYTGAKLQILTQQRRTLVPAARWVIEQIEDCLRTTFGPDADTATT